MQHCERDGEEDEFEGHFFFFFFFLKTTVADSGIEGAGCCWGRRSRFGVEVD